MWATELAQAPHQVRAAFGRQADTEAVRLLVGHGVRDEEWLTDLVFHARHRELAGRPPGPDEPALADERQAIRDDEIRPRLEGEEENFLGDIVRDGLARNAVRAALAGGEQNENKLTDLGYRAIPGVPARIKADDPASPSSNSGGQGSGTGSCGPSCGRRRPGSTGSSPGADPAFARAA